eukprot:GSChrysophyteH1.ASY1.ANO1.2712.1 assembled CDS
MDALKGMGAAGISAVTTVTFIHPIDLLKTRLQVSGDGGGRNYKSLGIGGTIRIIAREEGIASFWKGIPAAWLREASYTSLRLGLYDPIKKIMGVKPDSMFILKFTAGSLAGALGSIVGNPFDVLKTRLMTAEGGGATMKRVAKDLYEVQGLKGFYRGMQANVMRAMVLNGTKMGCYDQIKLILKENFDFKPGLGLEFCSAFGAGFFMTCTVAPFDMVRTKLMNQPSNAKVYNGFVDCFMKIVKEGGPQALYVGAIPIWSRFAPTTCLQLIIFSQVKPLFGIK